MTTPINLTELASIGGKLQAEVQHLQTIVAGATPPPIPTYVLTASAEIAAEGTSVQVLLHTTNVPAGTRIGYLITGVLADDIAGPLSGEFVVDESGSATVDIELVADKLTEGAETLLLTLADLDASVSVVVDDASVTPPIVIEPPPAVPEGLRYRYQHPLLFQPAPAPYPPRVPEGGFYIEGRQNGPTFAFVDSLAGWAWDKPGGDWIDADGTRHGPKPWAMHQAPAELTAAGVIVPMEIDITEMAKRDSWLAMLIRCPRAQRVAITGGAGAPTLECTYSDGTVETKSPITVAAVGGSTTPVVNTASMPFPVFAEFTRPAAGLVSAVLRMSYTGAQWPSYGGPAQYQVFPLDPPINKDPVTQGLSAAYPLDAGIEQAAGVFGAHRYEDGSEFADFVSAVYLNTDDERNFDPKLYGTGPENKALLPHKDLGKWIMAGPDWQLIPSTYADENFEPFAPGLGAMRIHMKDSGIRDGGIGGYGGSLAANAKLYLPADRFGLQRTMFVRCGIRLTRGAGFVEGPAGRPHVYSKPPQVKWTEGGGKFFPMPSHNRTTGGVSGSAGGGNGWQTRFGWAENDSAMGGPDENGWMIYGHFYDFGPANPPGHRYGGDTREKTNFGQRGGLGAMLYYDQWYDIEAEIDLNSVDQPAVLADGSPHIINGVRQYWTPDGAWRVWIDGRLAFERTGLVFRSLPVANPGFRPGFCRPCRELGAEGVWWNWFHGGVTQNARPRTLFMSGLVWGEQRIGPMQRNV